MPFRFLNNYVTQLAEALATGVTTLEITGDGAEFADASPTTPYALTLAERNIRGIDLRREIVHVTGRAGNVLTVLRGREGTTDDDWPLGTPVEARDTAAGLNEAAQAVAVHEAEADPHPQYEEDGTAAQAVADHEALADPHPQYEMKAPGGLDALRPVLLRTAELDLTDAAAAVTVTIPTGYALLLDGLDTVITGSDTPGGTPSIEAGPDDVTPDAYLANSPVGGTAVGDRDSHAVSLDATVTAVRVSVATAGTGTVFTARALLRGYLLEV